MNDVVSSPGDGRWGRYSATTGDLKGTAASRIWDEQGQAVGNSLRVATGEYNVKSRVSCHVLSGIRESRGAVRRCISNVGDLRSMSEDGKHKSEKRKNRNNQNIQNVQQILGCNIGSLSNSKATPTWRKFTIALLHRATSPAILSAHVPQEGAPGVFSARARGSGQHRIRSRGGVPELGLHNRPMRCDIFALRES